MIGPDVPVAVVWSPKVKRFLSLGWLSSMYDKRAPYTYDELAFDPASGQWENWFPEGKDWGPKFGLAKPPGWKGRFKDAEGNVRPHWAEYYWLIGAAANSTYLPEDGTFLFYIDGSTFTYDPERRTWKDLAPAGDPQNSTPLKTRLFWGSICGGPGQQAGRPLRRRQLRHAARRPRHLGLRAGNECSGRSEARAAAAAAGQFADGLRPGEEEDRPLRR